MNRWKSLSRFLAVLSLFAVLTAIMTYPAVFHMEKGYFGNDSLLTAWILAWDIHKAQDGFRNFWDANIFYPLKGTFAFSEHLVGTLVFLIPLSLFTKNIALMLNIMVFLTFILSGVGMYYLVRYLTGDSGAAIIAGIIYAFYPYRYVHIERIHVLGTYFLALVFLYWHKSMRDSGLKNLIPFALFFLVQTTVSGYLGVYTIFSTFLATAVYFVRERNTKALIRTGATIIISCLILLVFFLQYSQGRKTVGFLEGGMPLWTANPLSYFITTYEDLMWGWVYRLLHLTITRECLLFPGLLSIVLALAGIKSFAPGRDTDQDAGKETGGLTSPRKKRFKWDRLGLAIMSLLLLLPFTYSGLLLLRDYSDRLLGYSIGFLGNTINVPNPLAVTSSLFILALIIRILLDQKAIARIRQYWRAISSDAAIYAVLLVISIICSFHLFYHLLMLIVPGFSYMRVTARIYALTMFSLSVLAGFGVKSFLPRFKNPAGKAVFLILLGVIILAESACIPFSISEVPEIPPVYSHLPKGDVVLLELPTSAQDDVQYMYNSATHWKKLVNGESGFQPSYVPALREELNKFPTDQGIRFIKLLNVDFIILHGDLMPKERLADAREKLPGLSCMEFRGKFGGDYLYAVLKDKITLPPEEDKPSLEEIPLDNCRIRSSPGKSPSIDPENAVDGRADTYWTSIVQARGQYFVVDLRRPYEVKRIELFLGQRCSNYPHYFFVQMSLDGRHWDRTLSAKGVLPLESYLANPRNPVFTIRLKPVYARYIGIVINKSDMDYGWDIAEIKMYGTRILFH